MELRLSELEADALRETLDAEISRLLMEIANTDDRKMREGLRHREGLIRSIVDVLKGEVRGAA